MWVLKNFKTQPIKDSKKILVIFGHLVRFKKISWIKNSVIEKKLDSLDKI